MTQPAPAPWRERILIPSAEGLVGGAPGARLASRLAGCRLELAHEQGRSVVTLRHPRLSEAGLASVVGMLIVLGLIGTIALVTTKLLIGGNGLKWIVWWPVWASAFAYVVVKQVPLCATLFGGREVAEVAGGSLTLRWESAVWTVRRTVDIGPEVLLLAGSPGGPGSATMVFGASIGASGGLVLATAEHEVLVSFGLWIPPRMGRALVEALAPEPTPDAVSPFDPRPAPEG